MQREALVTLKAHIQKHVSLLRQAMDEIDAAMLHDIPLLGKSYRAAVLIAGLLESYYTCVETILVRISQFFENNLLPEKWHQDLLDRMTLDIPPLRPRILSGDVYRDLLELMRFRHFKRYYFGTAYDWDRLDDLLKRVRRMHPNLLIDFDRFLQFLDTMEL
jgi:hypothetical protein